MSDDNGRWLPQALMDALICPRCGGSVQQRRVSDLVCQACQTEYPVKDGIVLLCEDYTAITRNIKGGLTDRKNWYVSDQIRTADEGRYKHHIKKRSTRVGAFPFNFSMSGYASLSGLMIYSS